MKRFLFTLTALLLVSTVAYAGWNIKQKDDGSTVWINQDLIEVPVGDAGLTVYLENVSSASTSFVVTHKSGSIVALYATALTGFQATDNAPILTFSIRTTGITFTPISAGATITMTTQATSGGNVDSRTFESYSTNLAITQGNVIAVSTGGESTSDTDAIITIIIE